MTNATVDYTYRALEAHFFNNTCCSFERVTNSEGVEYMAL